jgi:fluoroquinolone resistance protein
LAGADLRGSNLHGLNVRDIDMTGVTINQLQQTTLLETIGIIVK